jgi:hypothetical protein
MRKLAQLHAKPLPDLKNGSMFSASFFSLSVFRIMSPAFRLSPFTFRLRLLFAFCFLLLAFTSSSCWFNPNMQTPGEGYLQGEWQQDSVTNQKQLLTYSLYQVKFSCDSFTMSIHTFSKVNTGADSCMNSGEWREYTRGTYVQSTDTLHLKGQFCNADMTIKDDKGCFRSGDYEDYFKVKKLTDSLLVLSSTTSVIPIKAHLIKRMSCHPKPI